MALFHMGDDEAGICPVLVHSVRCTAGGASAWADGVVTAAQAALAVMLSLSMVGSLAKLEVFSNEIKKVPALWRREGLIRSFWSRKELTGSSCESGSRRKGGI